MALAPVREDFCTTIQYKKEDNIGTPANTFPTNITLQIESSPLIRGVVKRRMFIPAIAKTAEAGTTSAGYIPVDGVTENLVSRFRWVNIPLYNQSGSTSTQVGSAWINKDEQRIYLQYTTANATGSQASVLDIETLSKIL